MSNDLTILDNAPALPTYMQGSAPVSDDLSGGLSGGFGVISFKGKTWAVNQGGQRNVVMRRDDPDEAASSIEVVILAGNPNLSKIYYKGGFVEGADTKPTCYSNNGDHPEADASEPQSPTCGLCAHNMWGSRQSDNGGKGKACSDARRLAVAPIGELDNPLLLRVPAASLKDLAAFNQQVKKLNAPYHAVVCKVGFDNQVAHPKLTFKALRWLSEAEFRQSEETRTSDIIQQIIASGQTAAPAVIPQVAPPKAVPAQPVAVAKVEEPKKPKAPAKSKPDDAVVEVVDGELSDDLAAALSALD